MGVVSLCERDKRVRGLEVGAECKSEHKRKKRERRVNVISGEFW